MFRLYFLEFYENLDGAAMKREFFGMSIEVGDTSGNHLLTNVLSLIEERLSFLFDVPVDGICSFAKWVACAKSVKPEMGYLLDWIEKDADVLALCRYDLSDSPSDELRDEINVTKLILQRLDESIDVVVLCSDFADAIEALGDALKKEINGLVEIDNIRVETESITNVLGAPSVFWQLEYIDMTEFGDVAASYESGAAFSVAA